MLAEGQCVYRGSIPGLVPFLASMGFECPGYHNPADYVMEVVCGEHGECVSKLVTAVNNGKCNNLTQPQQVLLDSSPQCMSDEIAKNYQTNNIVGNGVGKHGPNSLPGLSVTSALLDSDESLNNGKHRTGFPTSGYRQFFILLKRTFLSTFRDQTLTQMRMFSHVVVGCLIGMIYFGIGNEASKVMSNSGCIFFTVLFLMFTAMMPTILTCECFDTIDAAVHRII
uniref:ABC-2 type transporter transmembrane domain-containing protein n=1 Tax=Timema tahoe TaxID=61484 RepID=A0A7R9IBR2_9NEOP|nr:unnamed protein product [Timema tahoe]